MSGDARSKVPGKTAVVTVGSPTPVMGMRSRFGLTSASVSRKLTPWFATTAVAVAALVSGGSESAHALETPKDAGTPNTREAAPEPGQQASSQTVHNFNIPAGSLGDIAAALQKETGVVIVAPADTVGSVPSPGVKGVMTLEDALQVALKNTGIAAKFVASDRVVLDLRGNEENMTVTTDVLPSPKYTAPLLDLPQTLTIIPQDVVQYSASTTLADALRTVPGITFGAGEGGNPLGDRPFIRGVDTQSSTYIDGMRDVAAQSREVFDVESIAVSQGASGVNGGRGTAGGSINMDSKMAQRKNFIAGTFMPGSAQMLRGTVDGNTKVNNWLDGRLNGMWTNYNVNGRNYVNYGRWGVAPSVTIGLGGPTRLYLNYYHMISNGMPDPGMPYNNPALPTVQYNVPQVLQPGDGQPLNIMSRSTFYGLLGRDYRQESAKAATGRIERDLWGERHVIRNTFRYSINGQNYITSMPDDSKGNLYYGMIFRRQNNRVTGVHAAINQTDLSGQFKTGSMSHTYATGMEFSSERGNNDNYTINTNATPGSATASENCTLGAGAVSNYNCTSIFNPNAHDPWNGSIVRSYNPSNSKITSKSVYGFDTIQLIPHLQTTIGVRYDNYNSTFISTRAAGTNVRTPYSRTDNLLNYQAGLVYKPTLWSSLYGSISTSATPTGNALAQGVDSSALSSTVNANLAPEKNRTIQVGTKMDVPHTKALFEAAWFQSNVDNARITLTDGSVASAGEKRVRGVQFSVTGQVTRKLQAFAGYTYMNAVLVSVGGAGAAAGLQNGTSFPNTPKNSVAVTMYYSITSRFMVGGGVYAMSKVWGNQSTNKWVPGYGRVDLVGAYKINKHLNLQANLQNAGNVTYYSQAYTTHFATLAPGRAGTAALNFSF
ncbi:MAG: TonB-dependent receptor [Edaphobacter sp.]|uniref:TonB-dependent siderophore receptor n=1 Tax=Edaphobacter sp. TaxID=1934404 RepID=UPI0023968392|nr:TonB-dependent siderophore receptor [Edaphobacter sp.]MDE1177054.1 TonB-dependent receptor [Edaphobacter sp.]